MQMLRNKSHIDHLSNSIHHVILIKSALWYQIRNIWTIKEWRSFFNKDFPTYFNLLDHYVVQVLERILKYFCIFVYSSVNCILSIVSPPYAGGHNLKNFNWPEGASIKVLAFLAKWCLKWKCFEILFIIPPL